MFKPIIIALDFDNQDEVFSFLKNIPANECYIKVGKELFVAEGPALVRELVKMGYKVFLDLKFHDIPNTVYKAVKAAANLGVWMVNVHASGGSEMMRAAKKAINESAHKPLLIAVTILTSLSEQAVMEIGYAKTLNEQALHLAKLSFECGLDGVVCSAFEARAIKQNTSLAFLTITPGIRLVDDKLDDQTRIMTPRKALENSADYLVIGRPITKSINPLQVLKEIEQSIA